MPPFVRKVRGFAALLGVQLRTFARIAEPEPLDYPFADSDIAQLHRIEHAAGAPSVDQATWSGLLLDPYFAMLSGQVSIFGKQVLHQRLRDGLADGPRARACERVRALSRDCAQLDVMRRACRSLRNADTEVATLLLEASLPPIPKWAAHTWVLFAGVVASVAAVSISPLAWLGRAFACTSCQA